jgi:hypothetical protein
MILSGQEVNLNFLLASIFLLKRSFTFFGRLFLDLNGTPREVSFSPTSCAGEIEANNAFSKFEIILLFRTLADALSEEKSDQSQFNQLFINYTPLIITHFGKVEKWQFGGTVVFSLFDRFQGELREDTRDKKTELWSDIETFGSQ